MNILFYPSWYQTNQKHNNGIFFRDQAEAIARNCGHNVVFLITNLQWLKGKIGVPRFSIQERQENGLVIWEFSLILPAVFNRVRIQERLTLEMLRLAIVKMKWRYGNIDLIHAQSFLKAGYDACRLCQKYQIPVVTTEHLSSVANGLAPRAKEKFLYTIQKSKKIISVSRFLDSIISTFLSDQNRRVVVPNLVNREFVYDSQVSKNNVFTFLSVGHLIAGKRIDVLIDGFVNSFSAEEKVQLLIVGDGLQRKVLENRVQDLGRMHQIKFLGALTHLEVYEQMQKAHMFVHTSRLETFGVVIIEALASGLPVICTRCGGPEDILTNYGCIPIGVDNITELVAALKYAQVEYKNYDLFKISREAIDRFGEGIVTNQINEVYKSVVE